ncbi:response regulator [Calidifontibacter terrae]
MIRVVVVDDQALVRRGFAMILDQEPDLQVIGEAADGQEAVERCRELQPDVVLMDVRMPVLNGVEATAAVTRSGTTRVLMLTTFDLDEYVYDAIHAGASGFVLKDVRPDDLVHAVRTVAAGETTLSPTITRRLVDEFCARAAPGRAPDLVAALSEREREVFVLIAHGLSNAEIAAQLYVSATTVKTHVTRVLAKIGARDRVQAIVMAYEAGVVGGAR